MNAPPALSSQSADPVIEASRRSRRRSGAPARAGSKSKCVRKGRALSGEIASAERPRPRKPESAISPEARLNSPFAETSAATSRKMTSPRKSTPAVSRSRPISGCALISAPDRWAWSIMAVTAPCGAMIAEPLAVESLERMSKAIRWPSSELGRTSSFTRRSSRPAPLAWASVSSATVSSRRPLPRARRSSRSAVILRQAISCAPPSRRQSAIRPSEATFTVPRRLSPRTWMRPSPLSDQSLPSTARTETSALPSLLPWQRSETEAPPDRSATSMAVSMEAKASANRRERGIGPLLSSSARRSPVGTSPERWQVILPPRAWIDRRLSQRPSLVISRVRVSINGRRTPPWATEAGHQRRASDTRTCVGSIWPAMRSAGLSAISTRAAVKTSPDMPSTPSDRSSAANVRSGIIQ